MTWYDGLSSLGRFFLITGASSLTILIVQTVLALVGAHGESAADVSGLHSPGDGALDSPDADADMDADMDAVEADHDGDDGAHAGALLSVRGILAFTSIGSFAALALIRVSPILAVIGALVAGFAAMWAMSRMMVALAGLAHSGNLRASRAIGLTGEVYIPIPADERGEGKVMIVVQERLSELSAVTEGPALKTGEQVRVVGVRIADQALIVEPIEKKEPRLVL